MDLIIKNASLDEVTAICYRIGEPNFQEQVENERKFGVVEYLVNHNIDLDTAAKTYDNDLENTKNQVAINSGEERIKASKETSNTAEPIQELEEKQPEPVQEELHLDKPPEPVQEELHLDKPPEPSNTPAFNLKESLHQLATNLVNTGKSKELIKILDGFGAKSLPELNESHYEAAIEKIKAVQNG